MKRTKLYDAIIIGAGPNGLAAAITLAQAGQQVLVVEARPTVGGGSRSAELTLPGFVHDVCSAVHPYSISSPFFRALPLARFGLEWISPLAELAHPLDDGRAVLITRSVAETAAGLGRDGAAYRRLMEPLVRDWDEIARFILGPFGIPRHPLLLARFGVPALLPARLLAETIFRDAPARAVFAGMAAHAILPLERSPTAAAGLVLGSLAHTGGWPVARGGAQQIADALAGYLISLGGEIITGQPVESLDDLPEAAAYLCDVTPRQLLHIAGPHLPARYQQQLRRYRYGPGVFKVDFALDGPVPWCAPECRRAATVHLGGTLEEIAAGERAVWAGRHPARPFVLLAQQSLFDPSRAPAGQHTVWAYCHVPHGSTFDMTNRIEQQIERFAPGFRDRILARHAMPPAAMQRYNANYIGGDINGGVQDLLQLFTRPVPRRSPYTTPNGRIYLCSSSTPPGGGVHGMCGYHAAQAVLRAAAARPVQVGVAGTSLSARVTYHK